MHFQARDTLSHNPPLSPMDNLSHVDPWSVESVSDIPACLRNVHSDCYSLIWEDYIIYLHTFPVHPIPLRALPVIHHIPTWLFILASSHHIRRPVQYWHILTIHNHAVWIVQQLGPFGILNYYFSYFSLTVRWVHGHVIPITLTCHTYHDLLHFRQTNSLRIERLGVNQCTHLTFRWHHPHLFVLVADDDITRTVSQLYPRCRSPFSQ